MEANREFEFNEIHKWMRWHELKERRDHNTQWYENQTRELAAIQEQNKKGEATRSVNVTFSEPIAIDPCNDLMAGGCAASETPERLLKLQGLATSKIKSPKPFPISTPTPTKPFSSLKSSSPSEAMANTPLTPAKAPPKPVSTFRSIPDPRTLRTALKKPTYVKGEPPISSEYHVSKYTSDTEYETDADSRIITDPRIKSLPTWIRMRIRPSETRWIQTSK